MAKYNNDIDKLLHEIIEKEDLYGRSFTYGVALYYAIAKWGALDDDARDNFLYMAQEAHPAIYAAMQEENTAAENSRAWAEILDISTLDYIARIMAGEDEEGEGE